MDFTGKNVVVTGGASGIGKSACRRHVKVVVMPSLLI